jgi:hypothetical protein
MNTVELLVEGGVESLIQRARRIMSFGVSESNAVRYMSSSGVNSGDAFLAVKAASILLRDSSEDTAPDR